MNMIIRYYNQNRKKIFIFILVIVFAIIFIQLLNQLTKKQKEENLENEKQNVYNKYSNTENLNVENLNEILSNNILQNINYTPNSNNINVEQYNTINKFVDYCNSNQIENAYNMISSSCKENLFVTIDDFQNNYINKIFNENKTAKIEESLYKNNIFKVTYNSNLLHSGGIIDENTIQDYIYVIKEKGEYKISLNKFLTSNEMSKTEKNNGITIRLSKKTVYTEYEEYQIQIFNDSDKTISLPLEGDKVYLLDNYSIKYLSKINGVSEERLTILPGKIANFNIMFYKTYNPERINKQMIFDEIITNEDDYVKWEEKQSINISIDL